MKGMSEEGSLDAIERSPEVVRVLESVVEEAGLVGRVVIHHGEALSVLKRLKGPYDMVFIDADKDEYPAYLEEALRLTKLGSTIIADNMFWHGATVQHQMTGEGTRSIMKYTRRIFEDERLSSIIIPLGDGLAVSCRIK
jgi:predicted O-methyltransferase YrrM